MTGDAALPEDRHHVAAEVERLGRLDVGNGDGLRVAVGGRDPGCRYGDEGKRNESGGRTCETTGIAHGITYAAHDPPLSFTNERGEKLKDFGEEEFGSTQRGVRHSTTCGDHSIGRRAEPDAARVTGKGHRESELRSSRRNALGGSGRWGTACGIAIVTAAVFSSLPRHSVAAPQPASDIAASFPGLLDPGAVTSIEIAPKTDADPAALRGPDARLQLVVTANHASGQLRDVPRSVTYTTEPSNILRVEPTGSVVPLADGKARITAKTTSGTAATIDVTVSDFASPPPINFRNQVVPVFTKLGCNSGGCHGKSGGQNGFRLSLLGFEPQQDYRYLVRESRGRRLFPAAPAESLLLTKATNTLAHGGGERLKVDSADYRLIYRWIAQGMPYGSENDPTLIRVSVYPQARIMPRDGTQQLRVMAHYSDGSSEDVTHNAQYEPNDKEMAQVDLS